MKNLARIISVVLVLGAGVAVAWVDTRPGWDDTGITAMAVLSVAGAGSLA